MVFELERNFDIEIARNFWDRQSHLSILYAAGYLGLTYLGVQLMKNRKPIRFKWILAAWNFSLALMSMLGTSRTSLELVHTLRHHGFQNSVCKSYGSYGDPVMISSAYIFTVSKIIEMGDTLFLVLANKELLFLHWFHHSSVLVLTVYVLKDRAAIARWFAGMNYTVHSFMYAYFGLRALNFRVPNFVRMMLTLLQILQMVAGCIANFVAMYMWMNGGDCETTGRAILLATSLYVALFYLFVNFFVGVYFGPKDVGRAMKTQKAKRQ